jgi:hypothetical protein
MVLCPAPRVVVSDVEQLMDLERDAVLREAILAKSSRCDAAQILRLKNVCAGMRRRSEYIDYRKAAGTAGTNIGAFADWQSGAFKPGS